MSKLVPILSDLMYTLSIHMHSAQLQKYINWFPQIEVLYNNLINTQASLNQNEWFNNAILRNKCNKH